MSRRPVSRHRLDQSHRARRDLLPRPVACRGRAGRAMPQPLRNRRRPELRSFADAAAARGRYPDCGSNLTSGRRITPECCRRGRRCLARHCRDRRQSRLRGRPGAGAARPARPAPEAGSRRPEGPCRTCRYPHACPCAVVRSPAQREAGRARIAVWPARDRVAVGGGRRGARRHRRGLNADGARPHARRGDSGYPESPRSVRCPDGRARAEYERVAVTAHTQHGERWRGLEVRSRRSGRRQWRSSERGTCGLQWIGDGP